MVTPRERGRYAGYVGATFALATVSGPLIGGLVVDSPLGWRGTFFIGLPVAAVAFAVVQAKLHLPGRPPPGPDRLPRRHAARRRRQHPARLGLAGGQPVRLGVARDRRHGAGRPARPGHRDPGRDPARGRPGDPDAAVPGPDHLAGHRRLGAGRALDVRLDRLPEPVLPERPRDVAHRGRPDVDHDGRRPAGLEHRHRPGHQRDRALEALPRRRHGARRGRHGAARHDRRDHLARLDRGLHDRARPRPRRDHAEPRPGRAEQHRAGRHGGRQLGRGVLPVDRRLGRRLRARRAARPPGVRRR